MSVRDALLLNTTGSNFQALQTDDTARIKGDLSIQKDNSTEVLGIDVSQTSVNVAGNITASVNISSSLSSTGSFGRVVATTFHGDGSALKSTLPRSVGILTSSAQIAAQISGAFTAGFEFSSSISGSATSTGSFGRVEGVEFFGDGSNIKTTIPRSTGLLSSSKQIASNISGSFNKGFDFGGTIKTKPAGWVTTWYTGNDLNTGRSGLGGKGGPNAAIAVAGVRNYDAPQAGTISSFYTGNAGVAVGCTEEWNGTTWTEVNDATDAGATGYGGTTEAGYAMGKFHPLSNQTEEWNGTNWSEGPAIDVGSAGRRSDAGGCAPNTMYIIGGYTPGGVPYFTTFNGTNFTAEPNMPSVRQNVRNFHAGNSSSAIAAGGAGGGCCTNVWNGSSWSEVNALPFKVEGNTGAGTVNDAYSYGGNRSNAPSSPGPVAGCTDTFISWDGTSWSEITAGTPIPTYAPYASVRSAIGTGTGASEVFVFGGKNMRSPSVYEWAATSASLAFQSHISSASFGRLEFTKIGGDGTNLKSSLPYSPGLLSSSKQIASNISGSFNKGFEFSGEISGSIESTGSFGRLEGGVLIGDATTLTSSINYNGLVTGSAQIASRISGSFNKGFTYDGKICAPTAVWETTADMGTFRWDLGANGNGESAVFAGGKINTSPGTSTGLTEEWDGTSWTEVNDLTISRPGRMAGSSVNNGYFHGGWVGQGGHVEEWDGSSWSTFTIATPGSAPADGQQGFQPGGHLNGYIGGCAPDYLFFYNSYYGGGGYFTELNLSDGVTVRCPQIPLGDNHGVAGDIKTQIVAWNGTQSPAQATHLWNGSSWSTAPAAIISAPGRAGWRNHMGAGASANTAVHIGGESGPPSGPAWNCSDNTSEKNAHQGWDGTSWSVKAELPTPLALLGATGTENDTFVGGGRYRTYPGNAEYCVSQSYSYQEDLTVGSFGLIQFISASGDATGLQNSLNYSTNPSFNILTGSSQIASQICGSFNKGFDFSGQIKATTGGVFATSTVLPDLQSGGGGGSMLQGTAIVAGGAFGPGWPPSTTDKARVYDGASWSEVNSLTGGARSNDTLALAGDSSAGVFFGSPTGPTGLTEEWNGTNWTEVGDIPDSTSTGAAGGGESSESAIWVNYFLTRGHKWDGTSWSEINNLNLVRYDAQGTGTRDSFMVIGGVNPSVGSPYVVTCTEIYNGTNWSEEADAPYPTTQAYGMGQSNDAIFAGGQDFEVGSHQACDHSQVYDGTAWSFGPNINNKRRTDSGGSRYSGPVAAGATNAAWLGGGSPGYPTYNSAHTEVFPGFIVSGSFGRLEAGKIFGDASGLTSTLPYPAGVTSGSAQIASRISGSFTSGFHLLGNISGSATSTGSFSLVTADFIHGDGVSISGSLTRSSGVLSSSKQIASNISGSFNKGFGYEGTIQTTPGGVWSAGGALNATTTGAAGFGTKAAAIAAGTTNTGAKTEEYNGSSWSEVNDLNSGRGHFQGTGTSEAGIVYGGSSNNTYTEEWNGTNWSEVNDLIMGRSGHMKLGITSEAALAVGGSTSEPGYEDADVESWNGTNWSAGTVLPAAAAWGSSAGTYDSGIVFKWPGSETFCWNGSSWSEVADRTLARHCSAGAGSSNDALITGGQSPSTDPQINACTELYNGTSWSTGPNLISARSQLSSADGGNTGTGTTMVFGGAGTSTEHYNLNVSSASFHNIEVTNLTGDGSQFSASLQAQLLTGSSQIASYVSGSFNKGFSFEGGSTLSSDFYVGVSGSVSSSRGPESSSFFGSDYDPSIRYSKGKQTRTRGSSGTWKDVAPPVNIIGQLLSGFGHKDGFLLAGNGAKVEEFDGTSWTVKNCMNFAHGYSAPGAYIVKAPSAGTVYAGLVTGGCLMSFGTPTNHAYRDTLIYNGSNWAEAGQQTNTGGRRYGPSGHGMDGTQNAAILAGGRGPAVYSCTELFNGSNWTETADMLIETYDGTTVGTQNAAHMVAGLNSSHSSIKTHQCWDGSSWSYRTSVPGHHKRGSGGGVAEDFIISSQDHYHSAPLKGQVQRWDGTAWASVGGGYQTNRDSFAGDGTSIDLLMAGGRTPTYVNCTEVWEEESYATSSFGRLQTNVGGTIETDMFNMSGSTMKLPTFSDAQIDTVDISPQEGTSSIEPVINVFEKPGAIWFHSDKNALAFTYVSSSVYSQSLDFARCFYTSASIVTASTGFITQSHYCYHNVIQYITGSYT